MAASAEAAASDFNRRAVRQGLCLPLPGSRSLPDGPSFAADIPAASATRSGALELAKGLQRPGLLSS